MARKFKAKVRLKIRQRLKVRNKVARLAHRMREAYQMLRDREAAEWLQAQQRQQPPKSDADR